jgi:DNA-binding MurR/RpiR family transcriptional regulator
MSQTSEATVIRFCKKVGFRSYQEFKVLLAQSIVSPIKVINGGIDNCNSIEQVISCVFDSSLQALELTREFPQADQLEAAADILYDAKRVFIIGMGNSAAIGVDFQHKLLRLGITAIAQSDSHMQRIMVSSLTGPGDVVFAISHSGCSKDVVDTVQVAKNNQAKIISLTSMGRSPLVEISDICLYTLSKETRHNLSAIASRLAQMTIIDALHTIIAYKNETAALTHIHKVNENMVSLKC